MNKLNFLVYLTTLFISIVAAETVEPIPADITLTKYKPYFYACSMITGGKVSGIQYTAHSDNEFYTMVLNLKNFQALKENSFDTSSITQNQVEINASCTKSTTSCEIAAISKSLSKKDDYCLVLYTNAGDTISVDYTLSFPGNVKTMSTSKFAMGQFHIVVEFAIFLFSLIVIFIIATFFTFGIGKS